MKKRKLKRLLRRLERALALERQNSEYVRRGIRKILVRCPTIPPLHDDVTLVDSLQRYIDQLKAPRGPAPDAYWEH